MHGIYETESLFYLALLDGTLDLARNIHDRVTVLRVHPEIFGVGSHFSFLLILIKSETQEKIKYFYTLMAGER